MITRESSKAGLIMLWTDPALSRGKRNYMLSCLLPFYASFLLCGSILFAHTPVDYHRGIPSKSNISVAAPVEMKQDYFSMMSVMINPVISVRFNVPQFVCSADELDEYCLDVEFQSDIPDQELFGMNVRLFFDDSILEFISFRYFEGGYAAVDPNPPVIATSETAGPAWFNFAGPASFLNGAIQLVNENMDPILISDTGWTKIFTICFTIDDLDADLTNFCPPIVWDMEVDPANGGFLIGDDGVVITVVDPANGGSIPAIENVIQFNWEYSGDGTTAPFGYHVPTDCISNDCGLAIVCPADVTLSCEDSTLPAFTGMASASDACEGEPLVTYQDSIPPGGCSVLYSIIRTWTAMDICDNLVTCQQVITVDDRGEICGSVFNDLGEAMGGVELRLMRDINENGEVDFGDTLVAYIYSDDGTGAYCFTQLYPCAYVIEEVLPAQHAGGADYDHTPDPDGDDSGDGPDLQIPVVLDFCEQDHDNNFVNIICPATLPSFPADTICDGGSVSFEAQDLNLGSLTWTWNFGSGSNPSAASGLGAHSVSYVTTTENQTNGAVVDLTIEKEGCPDLTGQVSAVIVNPFANATIDASTASGCYYTDRIFAPVADEIPGATYQWNFGTGAVPLTATGYGPHTVHYTTLGSKTVKLVIQPNLPGAQCPDSSTVAFTIINCPGHILGFVRTITGAPIPSVNIRLYPDTNTDGFPDGSTHLASVNSTSTGSYTMPAITPGHYVIVQTQPTGWFSFDDGDDTDDGDVVPNVDSLDNIIPVTILPGEVDSFNNFIEMSIPGNISGYVFEDFNGDLLPGASEGIAGVTIHLFQDANTDGAADSETPVATAVTASGGAYTFTSIPIGHYVLVEVQPVGYISIRDFDNSNDGDVVSNTNLTDDIIPVTLINGETDAHNYFVEAEENSLIVTNGNDSGTGSLREVIENAAPGDTVEFHPIMAGQTILVSTGIILVDKDLFIISDEIPRIMISSQTQGLFTIAPGVEVEFGGLEITSGLAGNVGAAFSNEGHLILKNINIFRNQLLAQGEYLIHNMQGSELTILGNCFLEID